MNNGILAQGASPVQMPLGLAGRPHRVPMPDHSWHPEAADWRRRVFGNGGQPTDREVRAISDFCGAVDRSQLRDRFYRYNPFIGGFLGSLVPLYRGPVYGGAVHGFATDTSVNFVSGDWTLAGGITGNGSTKALNPGYRADTLTTANSHVGFGLLATGNITNQFHVGCGAGAEEFRVAGRFALDAPGAMNGKMGNAATDRMGDPVGNGDPQMPVGNAIFSKPNMYRAGVLTGTVASTTNNYTGTGTPHIFAFQNHTTLALSFHSNGRIGWYSFGSTMTAAQALSLNTIQNALYTAIGRS